MGPEPGEEGSAGRQLQHGLGAASASAALVGQRWVGHVIPLGLNCKVRVLVVSPKRGFQEIKEENTCKELRIMPGTQ